MSRDRFMFFENFMATAEMLDDKNRLAFYDALCDYVFKDTEPQDPYIAALLNAVKPSLDKTDRRGGARQGAGAPKGNINALKSETIKNNQKQSNQSKTIILSETETEIKETEKEIHKEKESDSFVAELEKQELAKVKSKRFVPPTIEQVKEYCAERKNSVDAERFVSYYDSNGWKVGKNPMKDWKAAVRTWERSGFNTPQKAKSISSPDYVGEGSFLRRAEDDPFCADL